MASKADLIFVEDDPLVPLPIIHLSACKCVRTKDFLLAVKTFFRCSGCLKTKGIYWGLICLSIFISNPTDVNVYFYNRLHRIQMSKF